MPEGDTVAKVAAAMRPHLVDQKLVRVEIERRHTPSLERSVDAVRTIGKHLLVDLDSGESIRSHLGMHGSWHRYPIGAPWQRSARQASLLLETASNQLVCFRAEEIECFDRHRAKAHPILSRLGPDLLATPAELCAEALATIERRARSFVHENALVSDLLLDQRVACGLGNVYKSEVLFLERFDPRTSVSVLESADIARLYRTGQRLLLRNLGAGWRNTRLEQADPQHPDDRLWVYGRVGQPCHRCESEIRNARFGRGNRSTYWCPSCQRSSQLS